MSNVLIRVNVIQKSDADIAIAHDEDLDLLSGSTMPSVEVMDGFGMLYVHHL